VAVAEVAAAVVAVEAVVAAESADRRCSDPPARRVPRL